MQIHDLGYKEIFSDKNIIYELLASFFKEEWFSIDQVISLQKINSHYVNHQYKNRESDMVWKIAYGGECFYIYLLLEFQSTIDHYMGVRLMSYIGMMYEDIIKSDDCLLSNGLPPVIPWVIYKGKYTWDVPQQTESLLDDYVPNSLRKFFPKFQYKLLDLTHYSLTEDQIKEDTIITSLINLEQNITNWPQIKLIILKLKNRLASSEYDSLRRSFSSYINRVLKLNKKKTKFNIKSILEEKNMLLLEERMELYWAQMEEEARKRGELRAKQEAMQEARQEAMQEARQEARQEAMQEAEQNKVKAEQEFFMTIAKKMLMNGISKDLVAKITDIPIDTLQELSV